MMTIEDLLVLDGKYGLSIVLSILPKKLNRWSVQMEVSALRGMELTRNLFQKLFSSYDGKALNGNLWTRIEAIGVLNGRPGKWIQNMLLAAFLKGKHPKVKLAALRLLLHSENKTAIRAIEEALQTEDEVIKREAESLRKKYGVEHFPLAWFLDNI
jgi:hypothetical protein